MKFIKKIFGDTYVEFDSFSQYAWYKIGYWGFFIILIILALLFF